MNSRHGVAGLFAAFVLLAAPRVGAAPPTLHLTFGGDVMFGRAGRACAPDALDPVADALRAADLTFINLETPLAENGPADAFRAPPDAAFRLARAGIDAVSLANNHAMDAGADGLRTTLDGLRRAGIASAGAHIDGDPWAPTVLTVGETRVALLAATDRRRPGRRPPEETRFVAMRPLDRLARRLPESLRRLRKRGDVDVIVLSLHWGVEGTHEPTMRQIALAHALVDAGVDVVWGHGAHAVHPVERRSGAVILYGVGNLSFDMRGPRSVDESQRGALVDVTLRRSAARWRVDAVRVRPLVLDPATCSPRFRE